MCGIHDVREVWENVNISFYLIRVLTIEIFDLILLKYPANNVTTMSQTTCNFIGDINKCT